MLHGLNECYVEIALLISCIMYVKMRAYLTVFSIFIVFVLVAALHRPDAVRRESSCKPRRSAC